MRRGITPVVSIILLLMMTVAAAGGGYAWIQQVQASAQQDADTALATQIAVKDLRCDDANVSLTVSNTGGAAIEAAEADAYLYRDGNLVATTSLDLSGKAFTSPGGVSTIPLPFVLDPGSSYRVQVDLPDTATDLQRSCRTRLDSLQAYWNFEDVRAGGPADAARGHHATYYNNEKDGSFNGDPTWVDGGEGIRFDGDDSVAVPHGSAINLSAPLSVTVQASMQGLDYASGSNRLHFFVTKGGPGGSDPGWTMGYDNRDAADDVFRWKVQTLEDTWGTGPAHAVRFDNGERFRSTITVTSSTATGYLNGGETGTVDVSSKTLDLHSTNPLYLGRDSNGRYLNGAVYSARLYNRSLSSSEVSDINSGATIRNGLVGEWQISEGTGTTVHDTSKWVDGTYGDHALTFDGVDDEVKAPSDFEPYTANDTAWTMSLWFKVRTLPSTAGHDMTVLDNNNRYHMQLSSSTDAMKSIPGGESFTWGWGPTRDTWHHAVLVYDGSGTARAYADGTLQTTANGVTPHEPSLASGPVAYGSHTGNRYFDGVIDDVRIYDTALTADQVSALYNATQ